MDQGSYLLIERGMTVRGTDADLGTVEEVIADENADVFRGIILAHGLPFLTRTGLIVPDQITSVVDSVVHVNLSKADVAELPASAESDTNAG